MEVQKEGRPAGPREMGGTIGLLAAGMLAVTGNLVWAQDDGRYQQKEAISRLQAGQPDVSSTQVLVLATSHLQEIHGQLKPGMLDNLMTKLARFRPDAICIERLPGSRVHEIELRRDAGPLYADVLDGFADKHLKLGRRALDILKTTPQAAAAKVQEMLAAARAAQPLGLASGERAMLVLWMLAAYEPDSAALQWSYLSEKERESQRAVPADLAHELDGELAMSNEIPAIASRLARMLGIQKLDAVDEFEDLDAIAGIMPQLEKDIASSPIIASVSKEAIYSDATGLREASIRRGDLLPHFEFLNGPEYARADVEAQWGVFLRTRFASGTDRSRLGLWENRNLKIAARIRTVAALHPGGRILAIYGAAHKPFLDAYLSKTADVKIIEFQSLASAVSN